MTPEVFAKHVLKGTGARVMPAQKPHRSKQDYATPKDFLDAVRTAFGPIMWDLAAAASTCVAPGGHYFGPDHGVGSRFNDALSDGCPWTGLNAPRGLLWLNPPFGSKAPWAEKCALEAQRGAEILFLVPASVGANWFWDFVAPFAHVYALSPRLSFDGKNPFPKDLILAHYRPQYIVPGAPVPHSAQQGFTRWRWRP